MAATKKAPAKKAATKKSSAPKKGGTKKAPAKKTTKKKQPPFVPPVVMEREKPAAEFQTQAAGFLTYITDLKERQIPFLASN